MPYKNIEDKRECQKRYYKRNKRVLNDKKEEWRKRNLDKDKIKQRKVALKMKYGMTMEDLERMIKDQNNRCAICEKEFNNELKSEMAHVDHDHKTNKVRELLCNKCNLILGLSNEDIYRLYKTISYIHKHYEDENY